MKYALSALAVFSSFALAGTAFAASEVLLTSGAAKKAGNAVALDIVSDGNASAFNFAIPLNTTGKRAINPKQIDLSKCLAELPSTHTGGCKYRSKTNDVAVFVYSPSNALLPVGVVGLGTITIPGEMAKTLTVGEVEFASPKGEALK